MKRKALVIILALLIGICNIAYAVNIPEATSNFFVNDFAGIFSDEQIQVMMEKAIDLDQNYDGIQVVVTTIKTLDGESLEIYANEMYNKYEIGKNDMGVLLLIVTEDRVIRAEIGTMMEAYIPDSLMGAIKDSEAVAGLLGQNKFAEGMVIFQDDVINTIKQKVATTEENVSNVQSAGIMETIEDMQNASEVENIESTQNVNEAGNVQDISDSVTTEVPKNSSANMMQIVEDKEEKTSNSLGTNLASGALGLLTGFFAMFGINKKNKKRIKEEHDKNEEELTHAKQKIEALKFELSGSRNDVDVMNRWIEDARKKKVESDKKAEELSEQLANVKMQSSKQQSELEACQKKLAQVLAVHPNIDSEIDAWIVAEKKKADMQTAATYDAFVTDKIGSSASMENEEMFKKMLDEYQGLTDEQKQYVNSNITLINEKYAESVRLRQEYEEKVAFEAAMRDANQLKRDIEMELESEIIPTRKYCNKLNDFLNSYNSLNSTFKNIFAITLINGLTERIARANEMTDAEERRLREEEERRRREEEERRRREEEERRRRAEEERRRREEEERRRRREEEERRRRREEEERRRRKEAEDRRKKDAEEARRRLQRMNSSFSSSSRSRGSSFGSFRGRGGSSSGGGVSGSF